MNHLDEILEKVRTQRNLPDITLEELLSRIGFKPVYENQVVKNYELTPTLKIYIGKDETQLFATHPTTFEWHHVTDEYGFWYAYLEMLFLNAPLDLDEEAMIQSMRGTWRPH